MLIIRQMINCWVSERWKDLLLVFPKALPWVKGMKSWVKSKSSVDKFF